ncbi:MAG: hypothetical protein INQ03_07935 [Candidatus Heimdallarchaeota archaeon]|nr:hypothetical protein [Candidatus Heimdallarchaeota archaeon]
MVYRPIFIMIFLSISLLPVSAQLMPIQAGDTIIMEYTITDKINVFDGQDYLDDETESAGEQFIEIKTINASSDTYTYTMQGDNPITRSLDPTNAIDSFFRFNVVYTATATGTVISYFESLDYSIIEYGRLISSDFRRFNTATQVLFNKQYNGQTFLDLLNFVTSWQINGESTVADAQAALSGDNRLLHLELDLSGKIAMYYYNEVENINEMYIYDEYTVEHILKYQTSGLMDTYEYRMASSLIIQGAEIQNEMELIISCSAGMISDVAGGKISPFWLALLLIPVLWKQIRRSRR